MALFWDWLKTQIVLSEIRKDAGKRAGHALDVAQNVAQNGTGALVPVVPVPFVSLDAVSWHSTAAHDSSALLFIASTMYSLKILGALPWWGSKVTAITSIFLHREVLPFCMVLSVGIGAFAFGYFKQRVRFLFAFKFFVLT